MGELDISRRVAGLTIFLRDELQSALHDKFHCQRIEHDHDLFTLMLIGVLLQKGIKICTCSYVHYDYGLCKPTRGDITLNPYPFFCKGLTSLRLRSSAKSYPFPFDLTLWLVWSYPPSTFISTPKVVKLKRWEFDITLLFLRVLPLEVGVNR